MANQAEPHSRTPWNRRVTKNDIVFAVQASSSVYEAAARLGVSDGAIYKGLKRYGIPNPPIWSERRKELSASLRRRALTCIVESEQDRLFVATIIGTEGTITCGCEKPREKTRLKIQVGMTDRPWVAKFADVCGVGPPLMIPPKYKRHKDVWITQLSGLRALMVLKDVMPYLLGGKLKEAQRAVEFFSPTGYREGMFKAAEIWPHGKYPWKDNASTSRS